MKKIAPIMLSAMLLASCNEKPKKAAKKKPLFDTGSQSETADKGVTKEEQEIVEIPEFIAACSDATYTISPESLTFKSVEEITEETADEDQTVEDVVAEQTANETVEELVEETQKLTATVDYTVDQVGSDVEITGATDLLVETNQTTPTGDVRSEISTEDLSLSINVQADTTSESFTKEIKLVDLEFTSIDLDSLDDTTKVRTHYIIPALSLTRVAKVKFSNENVDAVFKITEECGQTLPVATQLETLLEEELALAKAKREAKEIERQELIASIKSQMQAEQNKKETAEANRLQQIQKADAQKAQMIEDITQNIIEKDKKEAQAAELAAQQAEEARLAKIAADKAAAEKAKADAEQAELDADARKFLANQKVKEQEAKVAAEKAAKQAERASQTRHSRRNSNKKPKKVIVAREFSQEEIVNFGPDSWRRKAELAKIDAWNFVGANTEQEQADFDKRVELYNAWAKKVAERAEELRLKDIADAEQAAKDKIAAEAAAAKAKAEAEEQAKADALRVRVMQEVNATMGELYDNANAERDAVNKEADAKFNQLLEKLEALEADTDDLSETDLIDQIKAKNEAALNSEEEVEEVEAESEEEEVTEIEEDVLS